MLKAIDCKIRPNDSGPAELFKMICRGPSMHPTLRVFDVLHVRHYNGRKIRRGDVIVYTPPGSCAAVVHRVISDDTGLIATRGDNNDHADSYAVGAGDVIGQVLYAQRGKRMRIIHGGRMGGFVGWAMRMRRVMAQRLCSLFRPIYHRAARSGVFRCLVPAGVRQSVVAFESHGETQLHLHLGSFCIGKFLPELGVWRIRPPFKLLVDEERLCRDGLKLKPTVWGRAGKGTA